MAKRIEDLDKNFQAKNLEGGFFYRDLWEYEEAGAVTVEGLFPKTFCRMNPAVLQKMSEGVNNLSYHTAGGAVRFRVPGGRFAVHMTLTSREDMGHMPRSGSAGLDVYAGTGKNRIFWQAMRPDQWGQMELSAEFTLPAGEEEVTLYLPLYNGVAALELGFPAEIHPTSPTPYPMKAPVYFYGSSITQGGCSSRPGNAYPAMLSRLLNCPIHNLGFSGNAKGEPEMAEYMAGLAMTALVLDYDHNAPNAAHLQQTHLPFLKTILEKQPKLPVLLVSKPDCSRDPAADTRRAIILNSYLWAQEQGYKVAFADGSTFFDGMLADSCTVDGCHPNDLGFFRMAEAIAPILGRLIGI